MDVTTIILLASASAFIIFLIVRAILHNLKMKRLAEEALKRQPVKKPPPYTPPPPPPPRPFSVEDMGFRRLAQVEMGLPMTFYWHPTLKMELVLSNINGKYIIKGMKKYYVKAVGEGGHETWDRSLGAIMDTLRASFPEFHIYGCGICRLTDEMMSEQRKALEKLARELEQDAEMRMQYFNSTIQNTQAINDVKRNLYEIESRIRGAASDDIRASLTREADSLRRSIEGMESAGESYEYSMRWTERDMDEKREKGEKVASIIRETKAYGAATSCIMGFSTILRTGSQKELKIMTEKTIEDVVVADRYGSFTQSLERNFRIHHEEVQYPWLTHMAEYVGLFNPADLKGFDSIQEQVAPFFMKHFIKDMEVAGIKFPARRTPARLFKAFLDRVERIPGAWAGKLPTEGGWVGNVMYGDHVSSTPFFFPMHKLNHGYVSGTTGSGKSFTGRVLVENAIVEGVNVVVFDTTRQWCGLALPAAGRNLRGFDRLGVSRDYARGFPAKLYTPSGPGLQLPPTPDVLLQGCSVISLRGLDDRERCNIVRDVLQAAYDSSTQETDRLKTLIVIEEAHSFLPNRVSPDARDAATEVRSLIDRIARELRKYGVNLLIITQSLSDFQREARMVREMTNTKFFMRTIDRTETQLVEQYISDSASGQARKLGVGEALVFTPFIDGVKVCVRPPFSHVGAVSDKQIKQAMKMDSLKEQFMFKVVQGGEGESLQDRIFRVANEYYRMGESLNVTELMSAVNVSSKKVIHNLVDRLEARGKIRTRIDRNSRGAPRIIVPVFEGEEAQEGTKSPEPETADE